MTSVLDRIRRRLSEIFLHESWMIGVIDEPIANAVKWKKIPSIRWISRRSSTGYLADPFPWPGEPETVLCERYDFKSEIGAIKRLRIKNNCIVSEAFEEMPLFGHLSYPFLFEHDGTVYALPESSAARELALLQWKPDRKEWEKKTTLLKNKAVADSTIFKHGGFFWIAYTETEQNPADNLNLLYASSLDGPWHEHPDNPVARGAKSSRCAGTPFLVDGVLHRPAQDCSRRYGGGIRLKRVLTCSPTLFEEEEVAYLGPADKENPHGIHTLSAWGDKCLVDGKRHVFIGWIVWRKIVRRLSRLCRIVFEKALGGRGDSSPVRSGAK